MNIILKTLIIKMGVSSKPCLMTPVREISPRMAYGPWLMISLVHGLNEDFPWKANLLELAMEA